MIESMKDSGKTSLDVYNQLFHIQPNITIFPKMKSSVTSMPRRVSFQGQENNSYSINCPSDIHCSVEVYPGEKFTISAVIVGQLNGLVPATVNTVINPSKNISLGEHDSYQRIDKNKQELVYTVCSTEKTVALWLIVQQSVDTSTLVHISKTKKS